MTVNGKNNTEGLNVRRRALINQLLFEMSDLCPRVDQLQADSPKLRSASVLLIKRWSECPSAKAVMIKRQQRTDDQKDGDQSTRQWQWPLHVRTIYAQDLPFGIVTKCRLSEHELSWNAFPYCKTELTNPDYRKDDFLIRFETMHLSDRGTTKNALGLSKRVLNERKVVCIDIANDKISECREKCPPVIFGGCQSRNFDIICLLI
ncbi:hypothetical protein niasHT_009522 [Heterodera trifolii]|uniref:Phosphatidylinositol transfer protein N-terminal domain-containing protein n=1 Tax=Heterodera trifolii TaxID=157864 RepID=A0ABD2M248_9BILA